jgi:hypothetical protein
MKKFLTDLEIMKWDDIVEDYMIKSYDGNYSPVPRILIYKNRDKYSDHSYQLEQVPVPNIKYNLTFSVSSNRTEAFFDILKDILNAEFITNVVSVNNGSENRKPIVVDPDVLLNQSEEEHEVLNRKFTRYSYKFGGNLTSIMAYVSCITDAIKYFQMIWGYDEDGDEHCLLQYPIGSIVSKPEDKSKDYLILQYDFSKNTNDDFKIKYFISEMLDTRSSVIQYGESMLCGEDEICHSRNNRIDDILN